MNAHPIRDGLCIMIAIPAAFYIPALILWMMT